MREGVLRPPPLRWTPVCQGGGLACERLLDALAITLHRLSLNLSDTACSLLKHGLLSVDNYLKGVAWHLTFSFLYHIANYLTVSPFQKQVPLNDLMVQIGHRMRSKNRLVDRSDSWFLHDGCLISEPRAQGWWVIACFCCLVRISELHFAFFLYELGVRMHQDLEFAREGSSLLLGVLLGLHHMVCMSEALEFNFFISILEHELLK
jgi:hypothetical protein